MVDDTVRTALFGLWVLAHTISNHLWSNHLYQWRCPGQYSPRLHELLGQLSLPKSFIPKGILRPDQMLSLIIQNWIDFERYECNVVVDRGLFAVCLDSLVGLF